MNIDWGQIVTHIVGFLVAVALLKRYAWSHLLNFIEKRRQAIADSFQEIEKGRAEVDAQKARFEEELENIEATRRERIQQAVRESERLAAEIKDEARHAAIATREKAKRDAEIELERANEIFKDRMVEAVLTTAERMIREQLDRDRHAKLIDEFLTELKLADKSAGG